MTRNEALALRALSTPATDAPDAMEVLVDALLEAQIIEGDDAAAAEPALALRQKAFEWARRRLCRTPNPMEQLVEIVAAALADSDLPHAVVGVVRPFLLRIHFLTPLEAYVLAAAADTMRGRLPSAIIVEATCRP